MTYVTNMICLYNYLVIIFISFFVFLMYPFPLFSHYLSRLFLPCVLVIFQVCFLFRFRIVRNRQNERGKGSNTGRSDQRESSRADRNHHSSIARRTSVRDYLRGHYQGPEAHTLWTDFSGYSVEYTDYLYRSSDRRKPLISTATSGNILLMVRTGTRNGMGLGASGIL